MVDTPGDALEQYLQLSVHLLRLQVGRPPFGNDIDVPSSLDAMPILAKVLPDQSFDPISPNCRSHFFGGGNAKTVPLNRGGKYGRQKGCVCPPPLFG